MSELAPGATIAKYIDELEASLRYSNEVMDPTIEKAISSVLRRKRHELAWAGEEPEDFDEVQWLAPEDWRASEAYGEDAFYLYFELGFINCIDGNIPETMTGLLSGFAGAGLQFLVTTDALKPREWKQFLKSQSELLADLAKRGFLCDQKIGEMVLTIPTMADGLIAAFEDGDLETALEPIEQTIDRLNAARPILERLCEAVRAEAEAG